MGWKVGIFCSFLFIVFIVLPNASHADVFSSIEDMKSLIETEHLLLENLEMFLKEKEKKLGKLKAKLEEYQRKNEEAGKDPSRYMANPINAFLVTKRLTADWKVVEELIEKNISLGFVENMTALRNTQKFPTEEDLTGVITGLLRLQATYNLEASTLAGGILNGVQFASEMSSSDCYEIGRQSYLKADYRMAISWMEEAKKRLVMEGNANNTRSANESLSLSILEHLASAAYKEGDMRNALTVTYELLKMFPENKMALENKEFYEFFLAKEEEEEEWEAEWEEEEEWEWEEEEPASTNQTKTVEKILHFNVPTMIVSPYKVQYERYKELCRGKVQRNPSVLRDLRCRYQSTNSPFLKIAPFKYEEHSLDPYVVVFYDVVSDKEIEILKKMALPKFQRAKVVNNKLGGTVSEVRVSKVAWLEDEDHATFARMSRRTADMTGLDMKGAEGFQMSNYGIGGHYEPHYDFAKKERNYTFLRLPHLGNRIATVMYYLSDVEMGGATVFPELDIAVTPKTGTAIFWYNLHKSGAVDYRTIHGACPVIMGSKWVSNKWIHIVYQEFRRPCDLQPDHPPDMEWQ